MPEILSPVGEVLAAAEQKKHTMRLLSVLFANNMNFKAKIITLKNDYNIKVIEEMEEEVDICVISAREFGKKLKLKD